MILQNSGKNFSKNPYTPHVFTELNVLNPEFDVPLGSKRKTIQFHIIMYIFV